MDIVQYYLSLVREFKFCMTQGSYFPSSNKKWGVVPQFCNKHSSGVFIIFGCRVGRNIYFAVLQYHTTFYWVLDFYFVRVLTLQIVIFYNVPNKKSWYWFFVMYFVHGECLVIFCGLMAQYCVFIFKKVMMRYSYMVYFADPHLQVSAVWEYV